MTNRKDDGKILFLLDMVRYDAKSKSWAIDGKYYKVYPEGCSCSDYTSRHPEEGCKHMIAVREWVVTHGDPRGIILLPEERDYFMGIIQFFEEQGNVYPTWEAIVKFGEKEIDFAIDKGILAISGKYLVLVV